jgi:hypothetical protein
LFAATFRPGCQRRRDEVAASLEAIYLQSPAYHPDFGSIVHVDPMGQIDGFLGLINITLRLGERRLRGGVLGAFMAEAPHLKPAIGVSLIRGMLARRLDILFSDTANRMSLDISRALHFSMLPLPSLEWARILRPAGTAAHLLRRKQPGLARWVGPGLRVVDKIFPSLTHAAVDARSIEGTTDRAIEPAAFVSAAPALLNGYALRPAWDEDELSWALAEAALQTRNGPLHIREVVERNGRRAGLYLMYAKAGAVAHALQVLAAQGRESAVMGNLIRHAQALGAVSVRGAASREAVAGLTRHPGIFYHHLMSTIAWSPDKEVLAAIRAGDVFLGGLAGETWTRIFADSFI